MSSLIYNSCLHDRAAGTIDFGSDDFAVILVTSSYTPNKDTHVTRNDVTNEITGTGYTANGEDVVVTVNSVDNTNDREDVTLGGHDWLTSTLTARGAVYFKKTGAKATDLLVAYIDFGSDISTTGNTFSLQDSTYRIANT